MQPLAFNLISLDGKPADTTQEIFTSSPSYVGIYVCPHLPAQLGMNPVFLFILFLINQALIGGVVNGLCCSVTEELQIFDLIYSMDSAGDLSASLDIQSPDRKDGQV